MFVDQHHEGPSPRAEAWRRFLIETLLCFVLLGAIVAIALEAGHELLAGPAIGGLAAGIVAIVRHGWMTERADKGRTESWLAPVPLPVTPRILEPVVIERPAPPGQIEAVSEIFSCAGFDVEVASQYVRKGTGELPWLVQIAIEDTIEGFLLALGATGFVSFSALLRDIWRARDRATPSNGHVELVDVEGTHLILPSSLPDDALDALLTIEWLRGRGGRFVWDTDRNEWTNHAWRDHGPA
jgi:hypothetical protein